MSYLVMHDIFVANYSTAYLQECCRTGKSLIPHETETSPSNSKSADRKSSRAGRKVLHR